ncbi:MAG: hypothetical protein ACI97A_003045 [Planctomycetota bacterium]|jgi:hypothetical protein
MASLSVLEESRRFEKYEPGLIPLVDEVAVGTCVKNKTGQGMSLRNTPSGTHRC